MFGAAAGVMAQDAEADRLILHFKDGSTKVFNLKDADYIDFDAVGAFGAAASLKEGSLSADAFTVMVVPDAKCGSYKVTLAAGAEAAVDKGVFSEAAEIEFTGLEPLTQYTVTVAPSDIYGVAGTETTLTVTTLDMAPADPKVGDYFYSDGTWSDGGLISIDPDGQNAVWAAVKPAPVAGKTVVGIVFNTGRRPLRDFGQRQQIRLQGGKAAAGADPDQQLHQPGSLSGTRHPQHHPVAGRLRPGCERGGADGHGLQPRPLLPALQLPPRDAAYGEQPARGQDRERRDFRRAARGGWENPGPRLRDGGGEGGDCPALRVRCGGGESSESLRKGAGGGRESLRKPAHLPGRTLCAG